MITLEQFSLEISFKVSPKLMYTLISKPEGLARWFADAVFVEEDIYHFVWEGSEQKARLIQSKDNEFVKFEWLDEFHKGYVFEMHILNQEVSPEVALLITDYAEPSETDYYRRLWGAQLLKLQRLFNT
jgi:uncharacterized protein YndB with AHSA1/START domain